VGVKTRRWSKEGGGREGVLIRIYSADCDVQRDLRDKCCKKE